MLDWTSGLKINCVRFHSWRENEGFTQNGYHGIADNTSCSLIRGLMEKVFTQILYRALYGNAIFGAHSDGHQHGGRKEFCHHNEILLL